MPATKSVDWFLGHVARQVGAHETPLGSNKQVYGIQFGWNGVAWCVEFGWCMYTDAGVALPVKTASCVVLYDACARDGLLYTSGHCVPGDAVIRTWQHLSRRSRGFDPSRTHFQIVTATKTVDGRKWLGLTGGNQGAGYVGPDVEWVPAGDPSILGGLAFHRLFKVPHPNPVGHDPKTDTKSLPAAKSHRYPKVGEPGQHAAANLSKRIKGRRITAHRAQWRRLRDRINRALKRGR